MYLPLSLSLFLKDPRHHGVGLGGQEPRPQKPYIVPPTESTYDCRECCPNPWRKKLPKFLPMLLFPWGLSLDFELFLQKRLTIRPYGQPLLMCFYSWDGKSLEHTSSSYFG